MEVDDGAIAPDDDTGSNPGIGGYDDSDGNYGLDMYESGTEEIRETYNQDSHLEEEPDELEIATPVPSRRRLQTSDRRSLTTSLPNHRRPSLRQTPSRSARKRQGPDFADR